MKILLLLSATILITGCSSVKTIEIVADPAMAAASVQVDVVPDSEAVRNVAVSQYFLPGNSVRAGVGSSAKSVKFGSGQAVQSVATGGLGKKAVVLAYLPGGHGDAIGDADPRRKTIPLSGKYNGQKVTQTMRVNVTQGGISVSAVPKK